MKTDKYIIDKYEMYSFTIYLYFYGLFYLYVFEQKFFTAILTSILSNILFYQIFNFSFITLITHTYWKNKLNTIAMPQLLSSISNIIIYKNKFDNIYINIMINPLYIFIYYFINKVYNNEITESRNLRFIITFLFFFLRIFF
jgi:hypothetical protein